MFILLFLIELRCALGRQCLHTPYLPVGMVSRCICISLVSCWIAFRPPDARSLPAPRQFPSQAKPLLVPKPASPPSPELLPAARVPRVSSFPSFFVTRFPLAGGVFRLFRALLFSSSLAPHLSWSPAAIPAALLQLTSSSAFHLPLRPKRVAFVCFSHRPFPNQRSLRVAAFHLAQSRCFSHSRTLSLSHSPSRSSPYHA